MKYFVSIVALVEADDVLHAKIRACVAAPTNSHQELVASASRKDSAFSTHTSKDEELFSIVINQVE